MCTTAGLHSWVFSSHVLGFAKYCSSRKLLCPESCLFLYSMSQYIWIHTGFILYIVISLENTHICDLCFLFFNSGLTVFETGQKKIEKRKKFKENDASNIDGFLGPWAKYVDEKDVAKPSEVSFDDFHCQFRCMLGLWRASILINLRFL